MQTQPRRHRWSDHIGPRAGNSPEETAFRELFEEVGIEKGRFKQPKRKLSIEIDCNEYSTSNTDELDSLQIDVNEDDIF